MAKELVSNENLSVLKCLNEMRAQAGNVKEFILFMLLTKKTYQRKTFP